MFCLTKQTLKENSLENSSTTETTYLKYIYTLKDSEFWQTCRNQSRRTCRGPSADPLQSGIASGHSRGLPASRRNGSVQKHRPASWTRWAATAGTSAGNCRTAAEGSGGSWWVSAVTQLCLCIQHIALLGDVGASSHVPPPIGNCWLTVSLSFCGRVGKLIMFY